MRRAETSNFVAAQHRQSGRHVGHAGHVSVELGDDTLEEAEVESAAI
jgi:hypothetical protein